MKDTCFRSVSSFATTTSGVLDDFTTALSAKTQPPSIAMLFVSVEFAEMLDDLASRIVALLGTRNLLGCIGESIVINDCEIEDRPCVALWAAWLPNTTVDLMHLKFERTGEGVQCFGWSDATMDWPENAVMIVLGEPYSFPADVLAEQINKDHPGTRILGGMASGGAGPGESKLLLGRDVLTHGAVVAMLRDVEVMSVVSQGCRPIGEPFLITKAEQNVVYELGGESSFQRLKQVHAQLPNRDKELMQHGLHLGRVVNEYQDQFDYGDFLIRNVTGIDGDDGSLTVADYMRVGQTVQFHLRDAKTAHDDLRQLLQQSAEEHAAKGALLFTCNGRGSRLFDIPNHDAGLLSEIHRGVATAGFFCQGELGPVGGKNFVHGFTASIALFH